MDKQRILLVAGEPSGDMLAGALIKETRALSLHPIEFYGIAGNCAEQAGMQLLMHCRDLAVMGTVEILCHLSTIRRALQAVKTALHKAPPDLVVLIDYGGFNLRIAAIAHQQGLRVLYYVPPKFWAWRPQRLSKIQQYVDHVAVILPFEIPLYQKAKVPVTGIRHFLLDQVKASQPRAAFLSRYKLKVTQPTLCIMPGSRRSELKRLLKPMLKSVQKLQADQPGLQCLLPIANGIDRNNIEDTARALNVKLTIIPTSERYNAIASADVAIVASGTTALEVSLLNTPMVVLYRFSPLTFTLLKRFIKVKYGSLCNLLMQREIVPELIQSKAKPKHILAATLHLLHDDSARQQMHKDFTELRQQLDDPALGRIGQCVLAQISE